MASEVEKLNKDMLKNMSELEDSQIKGKGFDMKPHFMSDRQIAKKMISEKDPKISDEDLNLIVFGQDVKKLQGPSYEAYKTDNEVKYPEILSKDPNSPFKPLPDNDPIFDEVDKTKREMRNHGFLLGEKLKDIASEIVKITTLIINSIPAMVQLVAPPSFNVSGAIALLMLSLGGTKSLQVRLKEILMLLIVFKKVSHVVKPESSETVYGFVNTTTKSITGITESVNKLSIISEAKQKTLDEQQKQMDVIDTQLKTLDSAKFPSTAEYEAAKKGLEKQKETLSKTIEKSLK
jgi:hypothetical protein